MQYNQQMYVWKIVLQKFNIKINKLNSNVNISTILHLTFDMLCNLLQSTIWYFKALFSVGYFTKR